MDALLTMGSPSEDNSPVTVITGDHLRDEAVADLIMGFHRYGAWGRFAFHDIRQRFHRSLLGPLWLTASMGIMVAAMGIVFSTLFGQDIADTLPYISTGLIFWGLLTSCITDGTMIFVGNDSYIRNVPQPLSVHLYRMLARNVIIWAFNMAIYVCVVIFFRVHLGWSTLLFLPGFVLFVVNASWMALAGGILSTRFRDIPPIITSLVQVVFFITPVFWSPETLSKRPAFVQLNPLYHMLELVRAPLLGEIVPLSTWVWGFGLAVVGGAMTVYLYRRAYFRIAYWI